MQRLATFTILAALTSLSLTAHAGSDFLAQKRIAVAGPRAEDALNRTADNIKSVFERYQPAVDKSAKIVKPLQVGGTQDEPVIKVSIEKCVLFICKTVDLDASSRLREVQGSCNRNFNLTVDLSRSSALMSDVYDRLDVTVCFNRQKDGSGILDLSGSAHKADTYERGTVQKQIFEMLQMQVEPIATALSQTLKANAQD